MINIFQNINKVCKDVNISHSEFRVFMVLVSYNSNKKIFPSLDTIAKDSGIKSKTDISKKLNNLKERGYIEIKRRKHQSNIYRINDLKEPVKQSHPKPEQKPAKLKDIKQDKSEPMTKEQQERIFDRFYRADTSRTHTVTGTGLGMAIVKSMVQLHHGSISIDSELDEGTVFTISLPKQLK